MKFSHTLSTTASPEQIWYLWTSVDQWHRWDTELISAALDGDFVLGTRGTLVPKRGPVSSFCITELTPHVRCTFSTALPGCTLHVRRWLTVKNQQTTFTHEVWFAGVLSFVFGQLLGKQFRSVLPQVMGNLRDLAERSPAL